jgi:hypothetical protein
MRRNKNINSADYAYLLSYTIITMESSDFDAFLGWDEDRDDFPDLKAAIPPYQAIMIMGSQLQAHSSEGQLKSRRMN